MASAQLTRPKSWLIVRSVAELHTLRLNTCLFAWKVSRSTLPDSASVDNAVAKSQLFYDKSSDLSISVDNSSLAVASVHIVSMVILTFVRRLINNRVAFERSGVPRNLNVNDLESIRL